MTELLFPELRHDAPARPGTLPRGVARGVLSHWLVADGGRVRGGQRVAEVRTPEATGWVTALAPGTLWHQAAEGEVLMVGIVVALVE